MRPSVSAASSLESFTSKLCRFIVKVPRDEGEAINSFAVRRNSEIARLKLETKLSVRSRWALKLVSWVEHLHRHADSPAASCLRCQDDAWLRERRREVGGFGVSRSLHAGETRTRSAGGYPFRWGFKWLEALDSIDDGWPNPSKCKQRTMRKADVLNSQFLKRTVHALAIENG